ncbi:molybdate ABC transporter substrate-binding protein [Aurantiacibacter arachoides]|nr:molybdate ABC transporter substrate-binding protein [Aurantiacibacter arachoides]
MQEALEGIARDWEAEGQAAPVLSFGATSAIARQIESGAPADIVVTADREWMDWLEERDLLAGEPRAFASNTLVVVAPADPAGVVPVPMSLREFAQDPDGGRIALAETGSVPAGRYARAALQSMGLWDVLEPRVVPAESVRAALAFVERGEVPLGIVYATDAQASDGVRVIERVDPSLHPRILYYRAQVAASRDNEAQAFADYLVSDAARRRVASYGFGSP